MKKVGKRHTIFLFSKEKVFNVNKDLCVKANSNVTTLTFVEFIRLNLGNKRKRERISSWGTLCFVCVPPRSESFRTEQSSQRTAERERTDSRIGSEASAGFRAGFPIRTSSQPARLPTSFCNFFFLAKKKFLKFIQL